MPKEGYANDDAIVAKLLRSMRINAGISQVALANALEEPQSFVSKYENMQRHITVTQFIRITDQLGIEAEDAIRQLKTEMLK